MNKVIEEELRKEYKQVDDNELITRQDKNIHKNEILRKYNRIHKELTNHDTN